MYHKYRYLYVCDIFIYIHQFIWNYLEKDNGVYETT